MWPITFPVASAGAEADNDSAMLHGDDRLSVVSYLGTSQFWFEPFQNWQSEFLSVGILLLLSIFLRERGSPESKPIGAPNSKTGR